MDLGSSPGGWSQVARKEIIKGKILATDIKSMEKIDNVDFIKGDFLETEICEKIKVYFNNKVDVVLSDMAVNTSGNKNLDSYRTGELCLKAMDLAQRILHKDGVFYLNYLWDLYLLKFIKKLINALIKLLNINLYQARKNLKKFIFIVRKF